MSPKKITTILLLIFVIISVVILATKEFTGGRADPASDKIKGTKIVAYYLHGTRRCPTCLKIERYSHEAVDSFFTTEIDDGKLAFISLNYDEPQYEHLWNDYQLSSQSLVLVHYMDGVQQKWENMSQVWDLVHDQEQFFAYVKDGVGRFLQELK